MKVTENNSNEALIIDQGFRGLCCDRLSDVWWFTDYNDMAFIVLSTEQGNLGYSEVIKSAIEHFGPFTKYNGSITMEND